MDVNEYIKLDLVHSIHTSTTRSFRGCRRRWNWIYKEHYYPIVTPKPLEFGVAFHKALETYYNPEVHHDRHAAAALALVTFKKTVEGQYKEYCRLNEGNVESEVQADYDERVELGLGMLRHYFRNEAPKYDQSLHPAKVEIPFEVPIVNPDTGEQLWCKCDACWTKFAKWFIKNRPSGYPLEWIEGVFESLEETNRWNEDTYKHWQGLPVTFGGRIDMVGEDNENRYWITDWKTAARISSGEPGAPDDYLWLEDQITRYCWALWTLGVPVAGFIYAEFKKAYPVEPEPNKTIRLGRRYSVNKMQDVSYDMYRDTVKENDPDAFYAGLYDEFLGFLKESGTRYHLRHQIGRSEAELENAGRDIYNEACDMIDPNLRIYPSPGRFGCNFCAFREPCLSMNRNEDYRYTLDTLFERRDHYWVEREPSTESKGGQ